MNLGRVMVGGGGGGGGGHIDINITETCSHVGLQNSPILYYV